MTHILLNSTTFGQAGLQNRRGWLLQPPPRLSPYTLSVRSPGRLLTTLGREYLFAIAGSRTSGSFAMQCTANIGYSIEICRGVV